MLLASCPFPQSLLTTDLRGEVTPTFERLRLALCAFNQICGVFHILSAAFFELQLNFCLINLVYVFPLFACKLEGRYRFSEGQRLCVLRDRRDIKETQECSGVRSWL